jgi:uncharacterized protein (DUF1778 family)
MYAAVERIDLHLSPETKALIARAPAIASMSVSAFISSAAQQRARAVLDDGETLSLTQRDWEAFVTELDDLGKPRPNLMTAMERYSAWKSEEPEL